MHYCNSAFLFLCLSFCMIGRTNGGSAKKVRMIKSVYSIITTAISKWFSGRDDFLIFIIIFLSGVLSSVCTFHLLDGYRYNFEKNFAGVFIPAFLSIFYLTIIGFRYRLNDRLLIKVLILYCLQIAPFAPLFFRYFNLQVQTILVVIISMLKT